MREKNVQFTDLHNRLYERIFSFVRMRVNNNDEVKDIVQDVFLKAYKSWTKLDEIPDEGTAKNFLFVIARQRMIDFWRSGRSRLQTDLINKNGEEGDFGDFDLVEAQEKLPEDIFIENEKKQEVVEILNILNPLERELLNLRFLQELEYVELAEIYKTTADNIRQKVSRALKKIKESKAIKQRSQAIEKA